MFGRKAVFAGEDSCPIGGGYLCKHIMYPISVHSLGHLLSPYLCCARHSIKCRECKDVYKTTFDLVGPTVLW